MRWDLGENLVVPRSARSQRTWSGCRAERTCRAFQPRAYPRTASVIAILGNRPTRPPRTLIFGSACTPHSSMLDTGYGELHFGPRYRKLEQCAHPRDRRRRVLLRSQESVAARNQREHERTAAPILSRRDGSVRVHPTCVKPDRPGAQHASAENPRLPHARGYTCGRCCTN